MRIIRLAKPECPFKKGDRVMYGPLTDNTYKKAIVVEEVNVDSAKVKFDDGTEEITDIDNLNFAKDLNFDFENK